MVDLEKEIRKLLKGTASEAEIRLIFLDLYPRVRRFFRHKGCTLEEAEDHSQEVLARALGRAASCRDPSRFRSWVFAIASNHYRNELRSQTSVKMQAKEIELDDSDLAEVAEIVADKHAASPEKVALAGEFSKALNASIAKLPPKRRRALVLSYRGCSYDEIARILGVSGGTVKAHIHQARQDLKAMLAKYLGQDRAEGLDDDDGS